jgi:hypothetical protein
MFDHDRIDFRIDPLGAGDGFVQELPRSYFLLADKIGEPDRVITAIFLEGHGITC